LANIHHMPDDRPSTSRRTNSMAPGGVIRMTWKIGILGLVHDHVWEHVAELSQRDDVVLSVADINAPLLEKTRDEYGVERVHDSYDTLLEREQPDAVLVFTDNAAGA